MLGEVVRICFSHNQKSWKLQPNLNSIIVLIIRIIVHNIMAHSKYHSIIVHSIIVSRYKAIISIDFSIGVLYYEFLIVRMFCSIVFWINIYVLYIFCCNCQLIQILCSHGCFTCITTCIYYFIIIYFTCG